jgi:predicted DNA-binding transcriptional regulator|tara:strand:+ start:150 stop:422 length:273 start_codon:yes stop_codon:yes gene_type:complete
MELTLKNEATALSEVLMQVGKFKRRELNRTRYVLCGHKNPIIRNLHKRGLLRLIVANGVDYVYPTKDNQKMYQFIKDNLGVVYLNYFLED